MNRTYGIGPEGPDGAGRQQIPVILGLKELAQPLLVPADGDHLVLDVLRQALLHRLRNHRHLVLLVGRLGEALQAGRLDDRLAEGDDRVGHLDVDLGVDLAEVVHDTVEVELPGAEHHVLPGLLHAGGQQRVGLVHLQ